MPKTHLPFLGDDNKEQPTSLKLLRAHWYAETYLIGLHDQLCVINN